ncbi:MAG: LysR substrate-binding domain-containing protein [Arcobacteraceae bacterium]
MTLKELHFFYELSNNCQVTNLAKELNISQSAISLAIKSLEAKLGEPLFNRVGKKLILNERGRYFKENTYSHFLALKDAKNIFQKNKLAGNMKIASSKTISNYLLPDIYFEFLSLYPEVSFDIDSYNSTKIIEQVALGEIDIGFIETNLSHSNIIKKHLYDDELIIVTSDKNYPKEKYIDTIEKKWILRETGSGTKEIFMEALGDMAHKIDIFMQLHSFQEIIKIILDNPNTITAISKLAVKKEIEDKKLFEIKLTNISFQREFSIIYNKNKKTNFLFETFVDFLYNKLI